MDLRVLVLIADDDLGELIRAQVDNLGCSVSLAATFDEGSKALATTDAAIVDLAGDGLDDLSRLRSEAPMVRVLAIAPEPGPAESARSAGADQVLLEPFSIAELIAAVRAMGRGAAGDTLDLRAGAPAVEDAPWWATR